MRSLRGLPPILVVTGTDTDVGKTVVTAALAAALAARGDRVAAVKPVQTGVRPGEAGDLAVVGALGGVDARHDGARYLRPMAPRAAAATQGAALPPIAAHVEAANDLADAGRRVLVEGAGGLLVELDDDRRTLGDLAVALGDRAGAVVVCRAGLGTLNHTALTLAALRAARVPIVGTVIGSWPADPSDIERDNRRELASGAGAFADAPLLGALPAGAPGLGATRFRALAETWFPGLPAGA